MRPTFTTLVLSTVLAGCTSPPERAEDVEKKEPQRDVPLELHVGGVT